MNLWQSFVGGIHDDNLIEFIADTAVAIVTSFFIIGRVKKLAADIVRANLENPHRPLTVSFSPDIPGMGASYQTDIWVRTEPTPEVLFFNPESRRWQASNMGYGRGHAFINHTLIAYQARPTSLTPDTVSAMQRVADDPDAFDPILSSLNNHDPNDIVAVIDALGILAPFVNALHHNGKHEALRKHLAAIYPDIHKAGQTVT